MSSQKSVTYIITKDLQATCRS
uniref:Uncharacterized protein n=1 Tax=Arundo donax TaxID=35708 RepID=A0A0A9G9J9_ARUDO